MSSLTVYPILPGQLYIAGNSARTPRYIKEGLVSMLRLRRVVNLWRQVDLDWLDLVAVHTHMPVPDGKGMPQGLLDLAMELAHELEAQPGAVLIQCHAGANRSALLAGLVMKQLGYSDVVATIRAARGATALNNLNFAEYLEG